MDRSRSKRVQLFVCVRVCVKLQNTLGIPLVSFPCASREPAHNNGCGLLSKMSRRAWANEVRSFGRWLHVLFLSRMVVIKSVDI